MASSYGNTGRVNVSQYLRNLNVQEPAAEETPITDEDLEKDLALFTNTQFFDFETGQHTDYQAPPAKPDVAQTPTTEDVTSADSIMGDFSAAGYDFPIPGDFSFGDYSSNFTSPAVPAFPDALGNLQPIQPGPQTAYAHAPHHQPNGYVTPPPPTVAGPMPGVAGGAGVVHPGTGAVGVAVEKKKRKAETTTTSSGHSHAHAAPSNGRVLSFEDASRMAAEEDKRKRNTAASARFRIKKKQREQALEKSAKEMTDKVTMLEGRISALETENKWLKSLVTEKHGGRDDILEKLLREVASKEGGGGEKAGKKKA